MSKTTVRGVAASIGTTPLSAQRPIEEPVAEDSPATADDDAVSCDDGWATVPESFFEIARLASRVDNPLGAASSTIA